MKSIECEACLSDYCVCRTLQEKSARFSFLGAAGALALSLSVEGPWAFTSGASTGAFFTSEGLGAVLGEALGGGVRGCTSAIATPSPPYITQYTQEKRRVRSIILEGW